MTAQLQISRHGHLGLVELSRPDAINALSREMIDGIVQTLGDWRDDPDVRAVLFTGRGARGFCSGGDVRAVRLAVLAGRRDEVDAFFVAEYGMNALIAAYPKPLVALTHGIVMGGGIGIAGHCSFRFTTPEARFAMPEAAIGFFADVGVNAILAQAPQHRALLFLMTGLAVSAADAVALGLADCVVAADCDDALKAGFAAAAGAQHVESALVGLMQAEMVPSDEPRFCQLADRHAGVLEADDAASIVQGIAAAAVTDPELAPLAAALAARSPTSLEAIVASHRAARALPNAEAVLALDLRLARLMSGLPDFAEGVRAVLVDKDQRPNWRPGDFGQVQRAQISAAVRPFPDADVDELSTS